MDVECRCPFCGEEYGDVWEVFRGGNETAEVECDCGEKFTIVQYVEVTYTSHPSAEEFAAIKEAGK